MRALDRQPQREQRTAVESAPGIAGSPLGLSREDLARLVLVSSDLRLFGPQSPGGRETMRAGIAGVALEVGVVGIGSGVGLRLHSVSNNGGNTVFLRRFASLAAVQALTNFAASGSLNRTGWESFTDFLSVTGTCDAQALGLKIAAGTTRSFDPWLWVPPGAIATFFCDTVAVVLDISIDASEPNSNRAP